jgi:hypothetical protein
MFFAGISWLLVVSLSNTTLQVLSSLGPPGDGCASITAINDFGSNAIQATFERVALTSVDEK